MKIETRKVLLIGLLQILVLQVLPTLPVAAQSPFTLKDVLSAPFPSSLVVSPSGEKAAWTVDDEGVRNVWVAEAPGFEGRQLTAYTDDDGQALGQLVFTPDEQHLLFVRGGAPNGQGEIPNPLSDPEGTARTIHAVPLAGGEPRQVAEGTSPILTPDGERVVFLQGGQVFAVDLAPPPGGIEKGKARSEAGEDSESDGGEGSESDSGEGETTKPEALFKIRGRAADLVFSPDAARPRLAFVSNRRTHSYVGVYDLTDETLRYLDPGLDYDGGPIFSPDGRYVVYLRTPRERDRLPFSARRETLPWSIRIADAATGIGREVWRADEGPGSTFRFISADRQIFWAAGDRIVFPWEKDGWTHLYSLPVSGSRATLLTPGDSEVQFVAISHDRREILYSSNQDDVDRQHVWRVPLTGGARQQLTSGEGIEWSARSLAGGRVALLASGARQPAYPAIREADGTLRPLMSPPQGFPSEHLVEPRQVVFSAADGISIHGQLFLPKDVSEGERRPAVVFFHGGSRRQMLLGFHHRGYYHKTYAFNQFLASRGYVVLSVNYRSGIGYGMEFREAEDYGARGASEYRDVVGSGRYLRSRDDVDAERIGLWGGSYGGYLTALGLARDSDLFAAGVDLHGVHDWRVFVRSVVADRDAETRQSALRLAFESSPMASVDHWRSPVLLIHGDDDRNVAFSQSVDLVEALRKRGVHLEHLVFPDEVHSFLVHRHWLVAYGAAADFFDRHLGGERTTGR